MSIEFVIGDRKRFSNFISGIGKGRMALISHTDCDGIASARVVDIALQPDEVFFVDYKDLNQDFLNKITKENFESVVITDLFFKSKDDLKELSKKSKVLIIDHHSPDVDLNSENIVHLNSQGHCAAMIAYELFSKVTNLKGLDWLVACACAADWLVVNDAEFLTEVYMKYGDKFEIIDGELRKTGQIWQWSSDISSGLAYFRGLNLKEGYKEIGNNPGDFGNFARAVKLVNQEIDEFRKKFQKEKKEIPNGYFFELNPKYEIKGMLISELSSLEKNKTLIFATPSKDKILLSSRRQDGLVDLNKFMFEATEGIGSGGGHKRAAGGFVKIENYSEFKKRIGLKD
ncbi:MAG TPA: DHHA1 domain-containing protein [Candidatus Nanoarchaeia archaeon]|nr:DHHA1 domain-containing protein [Candidatus Nanoarchaeia archaeon]